MIQVLFYCNSIGYINEALYHWCIVPESASRNKKNRNRIKNLISDYISYISIIIFIKNNMKDANEFFDELMNHVDEIGWLCSDNKKIIDYYKISIIELLKTDVRDIDINKIMIEQYNFEKKVKELDRRNYRKHIVFIKNKIRKMIHKMIPKWFKNFIKMIIKHRHGK
ncbi:MAG: hypothetical protein Pg6A_06950 [Termitinemataceae bacterium]|nr:MAG: hypothetical protein Pg6A_06950 [Termitinemataceae bacterium]